MQNKEYFVYSTGKTALNAGTSVVSTIRVNERDFEVKKITGISTYPNDVSVQIRVTSENKILMNLSVPFGDLVGTAQRPSFVDNLVFKGNANIDITLQNSGIANDNVSLTFIGNKI